MNLPQNVVERLRRLDEIYTTTASDAKKFSDRFRDLCSDNHSTNELKECERCKLQEMICSIHKNNELCDGFISMETLFDALIAFYRQNEKRLNNNEESICHRLQSAVHEIGLLRLKLNDFRLISIIGRGAFGEVALVRLRQTSLNKRELGEGKRENSDNENGNHKENFGRNSSDEENEPIYAMKRMYKEKILKREGTACYMEERNVLVHGDHRWITKLHFAFQDDQCLYFVMDYYCGGDLLSFSTREIITEDVCRFYMAELILALDSIHQLGYVHRDVKPDNCLIDIHGHLKLADFGSCLKMNKDGKVHSRQAVGTPDYISPEILLSMEDNHGVYGEEVDWWSVGIIMYELLFGETPFYAENLIDTYGKIMNHDSQFFFPPHFDKETGALYDGVKNCKMNSFPKDHEDELDEVDEMAIVSSSARKLMMSLICSDTVRLGKNGIDEFRIHVFFKSIDWTHLHETFAPYQPEVDGLYDTQFSLCDEHCWSESEQLNFTTKEESELVAPFVGFTFSSISSLNDLCRMNQLYFEQPIPGDMGNLTNKKVEKRMIENEVMNKMDNNNQFEDNRWKKIIDQMDIKMKEMNLNFEKEKDMYSNDLRQMAIVLKNQEDLLIEKEDRCEELLMEMDKLKKKSDNELNSKGDNINLSIIDDKISHENFIKLTTFLKKNEQNINQQQQQRSTSSLTSTQQSSIITNELIFQYLLQQLMDEGKFMNDENIQELLRQPFKLAEVNNGNQMKLPNLFQSNQSIDDRYTISHDSFGDKSSERDVKEGLSYPAMLLERNGLNDSTSEVNRPSWKNRRSIRMDKMEIQVLQSNLQMEIEAKNSLQQKYDNLYDDVIDIKIQMTKKDDEVNEIKNDHIKLINVVEEKKQHENDLKIKFNELEEVLKKKNKEIEELLMNQKKKTNDIQENNHLNDSDNFEFTKIPSDLVFDQQHQFDEDQKEIASPNVSIKFASSEKQRKNEEKLMEHSFQYITVHESSPLISCSICHEVIIGIIFSSIQCCNCGMKLHQKCFDEMNIENYNCNLSPISLEHLDNNRQLTQHFYGGILLLGKKHMRHSYIRLFSILTKEHLLFYEMKIDCKIDSPINRLVCCLDLMDDRFEATKATTAEALHAAKKDLSLMLRLSMTRIHNPFHEFSLLLTAQSESLRDEWIDQINDVTNRLEKRHRMINIYEITDSSMHVELKSINCAAIFNPEHLLYGCDDGIFVMSIGTGYSLKLSEKKVHQIIISHDEQLIICLATMKNRLTNRESNKMQTIIRLFSFSFVTNRIKTASLHRLQQQQQQQSQQFTTNTNKQQQQLQNDNISTISTSPSTITTLSGSSSSSSKIITTIAPSSSITLDNITSPTSQNHSSLSSPSKTLGTITTSMTMQPSMTFVPVATNELISKNDVAIDEGDGNRYPLIKSSSDQQQKIDYFKIIDNRIPIQLLLMRNNEQTLLIVIYFRRSECTIYELIQNKPRYRRINELHLPFNIDHIQINCNELILLTEKGIVYRFRPFDFLHRIECNKDHCQILFNLHIYSTNPFQHNNQVQSIDTSWKETVRILSIHRLSDKELILITNHFALFLDTNGNFSRNYHLSWPFTIHNSTNINYIKNSNCLLIFNHFSKLTLVYNLSEGDWTQTVHLQKLNCLNGSSIYTAVLEDFDKSTKLLYISPTLTATSESQFNLDNSIEFELITAHDYLDKKLLTTNFSKKYDHRMKSMKIGKKGFSFMTKNGGKPSAILSDEQEAELRRRNNRKALISAPTNFTHLTHVASTGSSTLSNVNDNLTNVSHIANIPLTSKNSEYRSTKESNEKMQKIQSDHKKLTKLEKVQSTSSETFNDSDWTNEPVYSLTIPSDYDNNTTNIVHNENSRKLKDVHTLHHQEDKNEIVSDSMEITSINQFQTDDFSFSSQNPDQKSDDHKSNNERFVKDEDDYLPFERQIEEYSSQLSSRLAVIKTNSDTFANSNQMKSATLTKLPDKPKFSFMSLRQKSSKNCRESSAENIRKRMKDSSTILTLSNLMKNENKVKNIIDNCGTTLYDKKNKLKARILWNEKFHRPTQLSSSSSEDPEVAASTQLSSTRAFLKSHSFKVTENDECFSNNMKSSKPSNNKKRFQNRKYTDENFLKKNDSDVTDSPKISSKSVTILGHEPQTSNVTSLSTPSLADDLNQNDDIFMLTESISNSALDYILSMETKTKKLNMKHSKSILEKSTTTDEKSLKKNGQWNKEKPKNLFQRKLNKNENNNNNLIISANLRSPPPILRRKHHQCN
ncbi:hypothetical protein SNEBB_010997 [Seison nebaliae]|nr:hypothetical protein SNEBB_010997 [Seison nebaliae]